MSRRQGAVRKCAKLRLCGKVLRAKQSTKCRDLAACRKAKIWMAVCEKRVPW